MDEIFASQGGWWRWAVCRRKPGSFSLESILPEPSEPPSSLLSSETPDPMKDSKSTPRITETAKGL
ncbi:hypothetical protein E4Q08_03940 [Candidatus Accumulibacter phosphatis]|jgi:hypothetical protein|uniref:Uncharacterized protein n=1 Tax=Candidatus Accumulibacter contiguus TaxID=2954381 RepID=A0ABX1T5S9_9PROT|nr:hypothetical protein [Candidatus Accumulibacter contiguus]